MAAPTSTTSQRLAGANRAALIVVGILSLLGLAYAIARVDILRARIVDLRTEVTNTKEAEARLTEQVQTLQSQLQQQGNQLAQAQETLDHLSSGLNRQIAQATVQWSRSEILYLLRLTQAQLHQGQDIVGARSTLQAALARSLAQPGAIPESTLSALQVAMQQLSVLPDQQWQQIDRALMSAEHSVGQLPVASALGVSARSTDHGAWFSIRSALEQLFSLRRTGERASDISDRISASQLRELLRQQLITARLAAKRHDQAGYTAALADASQLVAEHYDVAQATTRQLQQTLIDLAHQPVNLTLPDLSASISSVANLLAEGDGR